MLGSTARLAVLASALANVLVCAFPDISVVVKGPSSVTDVQSFSVSTVITNHGDEAVTLLNSPDSILAPKWKTNSFGVVSQDRGLAARFVGVKVKWNHNVALAKGDVTVIPARESITISQDLGGVYDFSSIGEGPYEISANAKFLALDGSGDVHPLRAVKTKSHVTRISGKLTPVTRRALETGDITYNNCTSSQESLIATAAKSSQDYIDAVNSYLSTLKKGTPRWTTWFGNFTSSSKSTIVSHFSKMSGDPENTMYDCGCTDPDVYAYVYPDQPGQIYLCGYFWKAPNTGTDSKAGTIIHESSHFTNNGGTEDYVYGQDGCKELAESDPDEAIMNADSHEYFAENDPFQE
ncbi:hypothetical protein FRB99_004824 [Tulasnella sp. 403]|nr:hypothetical protein FRB99_004824 [Tulasnella sp. 403]